MNWQLATAHENAFSGENRVPGRRCRQAASLRDRCLRGKLGFCFFNRLLRLMRFPQMVDFVVHQSLFLYLHKHLKAPRPTMTTSS